MHHFPSPRPPSSSLWCGCCCCCSCCSEFAQLPHLARSLISRRSVLYLVCRLLTPFPFCCCYLAAAAAARSFGRSMPYFSARHQQLLPVESPGVETMMGWRPRSRASAVTYPGAESGLTGKEKLPSQNQEILSTIKANSCTCWRNSTTALLLFFSYYGHRVNFNEGG